LSHVPPELNTSKFITLPAHVAAARLPQVPSRIGRVPALPACWIAAGLLSVRIGGPKVTGRADRPGFNTESVEHTLAKVKALAEARSVAA
jgi:hypothetical protein